MDLLGLERADELTRRIRKLIAKHRISGGTATGERRVSYSTISTSKDHALVIQPQSIHQLQSDTQGYVLLSRMISILFKKKHQYFHINIHYIE